MANLRETKFYKTLNNYLACAYAEGFCEGAEATDKERTTAFQYLIDSGMVWKLQGWYGRTASRLIDSGECLKANN